MAAAVGGAGAEVTGVGSGELGVVSFGGVVAETLPPPELPTHNSQRLGRESVTAPSTHDPQLTTTMTMMKRLLTATLLALTAFTAHAELPFIENDYVKAMARARAKNVPVFVEAWAPW